MISPKTVKSTSVTAVPKHLMKGPSISSHVIPAIDPATMSYHPAEKKDGPSPACLQLSSRSHASLHVASLVVRLAPSMTPMVAWLSTGECSTSVLF